MAPPYNSQPPLHLDSARVTSSISRLEYLTASAQPSSNLSLIEAILKALCAGCGGEDGKAWISELSNGVEDMYLGKCLDPYQALLE